MNHRHLLTPFFLETPLPAARSLAADDWIVNAPEVEGDQFARVGAVIRHLATLVADVRATGATPVSLGGDCCQSIGVLAGVRRSGVEPVLLWLDAHGDFNTWDTSPSGFIGGMPLAMLAGRGDQRLLEAVGLSALPERDIVLADARDLDPLERRSLEASGVRHVTRIEDVVAALPADRPLYVHFDVDLLDPSEAPAMLYPVPGGPSAARVRALFATLARTREIAAVSLTLWQLGQDERTGPVCLETLAKLTGAPWADR